MSKTIIKVENLSKRYRIGLKEELHDTFFGALASWVKYPFSNYKRLQKLSKFDENTDSMSRKTSKNVTIVSDLFIAFTPALFRRWNLSHAMTSGLPRLPKSMVPTASGL